MPVQPANDVHPILLAVEVQRALNKELDWLRLASGSYRLPVLRRLAQYSADRLHTILRDDLNLGCEGVRFVLPDPTDDDARRKVQVLIAWKGGRAADVVRALGGVLHPTAQA